MDTQHPTTAATATRIRWANELAAHVDSALDRAWHTAAVLGYELIKIKESLCHGHFNTLFRQAAKKAGGPAGMPAFTFSQQMANNYMRLARLCMAAAGKVGQAEALATLFENATALPAPAGEGALVLSAHPLQGDLHALANTLHSLAPEAHSMRQAMFAFMEAPASRKAPEDILPGLRELNNLLHGEDTAGQRPAFAAPNRAGQVRKPRNLEADRAAADRLIRAATLDLGNLIAAGRHVACSPQVRAAACLALEQALTALRAVK